VARGATCCRPWSSGKFGRAGSPANGHSVRIDRWSVNVRSCTLERLLTGEPSDRVGFRPSVVARMLVVADRPVAADRTNGMSFSLADGR
jgi:hypothetical protein